MDRIGPFEGSRRATFVRSRSGGCHKTIQPTHPDFASRYAHEPAFAWMNDGKAVARSTWDAPKPVRLSRAEMVRIARMEGRK